MILPASDKEEDFINFLKNKIKNETEYEDFYSGYKYDYIIENLEKTEDNLKLILDENGNIITFYNEETFDDISIIDIDDQISKNELEQSIQELKNNYDHPMLVHSYILEDLDQTFTPNLKSNFVKNANYDLKHSLLALKKEDIDLIRDRIEEKEFPEYTNNLSIEILSNKQILEQKYKDTNNPFINSFWSDNISNGTIKTGFHYFGQDDSFEKDDKILAIKDNDNIVGVIKYGIYQNKYALCFIDVKLPYRNNGIATRLMEEFGKQIEKENEENQTNYPLKLTAESVLGAQCHMKDKAISLIKNTEVLVENHHTYELEKYLNGNRLENKKEKSIEIEI